MVKDMKYLQLWEFLRSEDFYDFILNDGSLLQFRYENETKFSYSYFEFPFNQQYIDRLDFFQDPEKYIDADIDADKLEEFYEFITSNWTKRSNTSPIRYDFDPECYNPGLHPASHIHIGHENQIRIGTRRILEPIAFLLFILRQTYPDYWKRVLADAKNHFFDRRVRDKLSEIDNSHISDGDFFEMYLE
jgi:hypothetical protein